MPQRLFDAYAKEVAKVHKNGDGVISFEEAEIDGTSAGGQPNSRLYVPATQFNRYAMTRELNDGLLAPRFAPRFCGDLSEAPTGNEPTAR